MISFRNITRGALLLLALATSAGIAACEDDPILQPNTGNENGGSYGRIDMIGPDNSASKPVERTGNDISADHSKNPSIF